MKRLITLAAVCLAGVSLAACGNNDKQAKENSSLKAQNSSLKAKQQSRENSSLKAENDSLKNDKDNQSANTSNTSNSSNSQEDPANLSDAEVAQRVKTAKGDTAPEYNTIVINNGDGTYNVELRKDAPDGQVSNMIGTYTYNAKTGAITTTFETGLD
jgi:hypothetical protein